MPRARHLARLHALVVLLVLAACGGEEAGAPAAAPAPPASRAVAFPSPGARSLAEIRREMGPGLELAPGTAVLEPGRNRFGFALFDRARRQFGEAPVALYVAPAGGGPVEGPFPAEGRSLRVRPRFESRSVATDPDAARSIYTAELPFRRAGEHRVLALARLDERLVATEPLTVRVSRDAAVPEVGERAPRGSTPTLRSTGGALDLLETRDPPDTMHQIDFAEVVGRRPAIVVFATPALCRSRVCGPVVDVAEQVKSGHAGEAAFIHVEIYEQNRIEAGLRPEVRRWRLPTEPWAFAVDRQGRIAARLEGAFSAGELEAALRRAVAG